MKQVTAEEYKKLQDAEWQWANSIIDKQKYDSRKYVNHRDGRPIIDIKQMIESTHDLYKDKPAFYEKFIKGPYTPITYDQFYNDINGVGTAFITKLGLKDKRIGVIGETKYTWGVADLSVLCGTGIVVPIDKELPYNDLLHVVKESEISAIVFDSKREESFVRMKNEGETKLEYLISQDRSDDGDGILSLLKLADAGKALIAEGDRSFLDAQIDNEEMALILFTSGTTGLAKGIMLSHKNLCTNVMCAPTFQLPLSTDTFFSVLPIHHTFEFTAGFLEPLYQGSAIAHCEGLKYITKNIQEIHPTYILAVPAIFEALHKAIWKGIKKKGKEKTVVRAMKISNAAKKLGIDLTDKFFGEIKQSLGGSIRMMICGGAAINPQILDDFNSFGMLALQGYGLSECAPMAALNPEIAPNSASIGMALPGTDVKIDNPGDDGIGEICIKGDNVMLGYYKNQEATDASLKDGWYYTGDLGYIDDKGYIYITGRSKNVIITKNGKNVFPEEIEYQLSLNDVVTESMVFEDTAASKDDTLIVAAIYPDWAMLKEILGDGADDIESVRKYLWSLVDPINNENPPYKMIRRIVVRKTEFERNTSRKIRRFVPENKEEI